MRGKPGDILVSLRGRRDAGTADGCRRPETREGVNSPWGKLLRVSNQRIPVVEQNQRLQDQYLDRD